MQELDWVRSKATKRSTEVFTVTAGEAETVEQIGTYESVLFVFEGNIPARMMSALRNSKSLNLTKTELENETIRLGGNGYRSQYTHCWYSRTVYRKVA